MKTYKLKTGYQMPVFGLGTWELTGKLCQEIVRRAIELGYRHIDTAELYSNEQHVGKGIQGFDRDKLFIVSKVKPENFTEKGVRKSCKRSLRKLKTDYLDLYLLHWPNDSIPLEETMSAMAELVEDGRIRSLGVSNFDISRVEKAIQASEVPVCVNQVEC
ncbi:aldo/keto reductase, partial [Candidatus Woesearchaeota archaeon]|nr:aldo/keto reductase [Candidatus Woesearchaeota archaeon]